MGALIVVLALVSSPWWLPRLVGAVYRRLRITDELMAVADTVAEPECRWSGVDDVAYRRAVEAYRGQR